MANLLTLDEKLLHSTQLLCLVLKFSEDIIFYLLLLYSFSDVKNDT